MSQRIVRYVETRAARQLRAALGTAVQLGCPVLAVGDAGLGKTVALKRIAAETGAAYCEVAQHTKNIKPMFQLLHDAFGIYQTSKFVYDLALALKRQIGSKTPLIVDEYQNFAPTVLRELLHIQEHCGFPLLLVGNRERLAGGRRDAGALDQIASRLPYTVAVGKPTRDDCVNIGVEYNVEGRDAYEALANYGQGTSLRSLCFLLDMCAAATGGRGSIALRHIETALGNMTPAGRDALKLLSASATT